MLKIGIGGDIVPTQSNIDYFASGDKEYLIGNELANQLNRYDYTLFNLEVPLTDINSPIKKCGPNLIAPESSINGLKEINPHFFTLANNHIYDQGLNGLNTTIKLLKDKQIDYAGCGNNINDIKKFHIYQKDNIKIGIYCCAEHEFSIATEKSAGANPFDPLESFDDILELKSKTDFVIVLYHGGKEHYQYPSPRMQRIFHKFADKGADIVVGQHSHCIGCEEKYKNASLIYGQGNFLFDVCDNELWQSSLFIDLGFNKESYSIKYIPLKKMKNQVRIAKGLEAQNILNDFKARSISILEQGFVLSEYNKLCDSMTKSYLRVITGNKNILQKIFIKIFKPSFRYYYKAQNKLNCLNYLECEAHNELLINILKRNALNDK